MAQTFVEPSEIYGWFRGWHDRRQEYREIFISNVIQECEEERNRIISRMSLFFWACEIFSWMLRIIQNFFFGKSFLQDKHLFINSVKSWPRRRDAKKSPPNIRRSLMHVFFKVSFWSTYYIRGCHWSLGSSTKSGSLRSSHGPRMVMGTRIGKILLRLWVATLQSWPRIGKSP